QPRVHLVLHVALQHAVFDQRRALRRRALVVDVERAAPARERAIVDHGALLGRHALADLAAERGRALVVEVAFESVADGLVQQNSGPPGAEYATHVTGRP